MISRRTNALLLLLIVLALGFWLGQGWLGARAGLDPSASRGSVLAATGEGLSPPGGEADGSAAGTAHSQRQAIALDVPPEVQESPDSQALATGETRLRGTVVRGASPVAGARVVARTTQGWIAIPADMEDMRSMGLQGPRYESTTDEEGRFEFFDVPAGHLALAIRAPGLAPLERGALEVPEHQQYDLGRFELQPGISLEGRVLGADGKGLAGVSVLSAVSRASGSTRLELPGTGILLATTDAGGAFQLPGLAPGSWHLIFDAPGHLVQELQGSTLPAGRHERGLQIQLEPGLAIEGRVLGLESMDGAALRVVARRSKEQPSAAADAAGGAERSRAREAQVQLDGTFRVDGLAPGVRYKLRLYRQELASNKPDALQPAERWEPLQGVPDRVEMAGAGQVEFKCRALATIAFQVENAHTGEPLEHFEVHVSGDELFGGGVLKDAEDQAQALFPGGTVRYENLAPAPLGSRCVLRVRAPGFEDHEQRDLMLRPGEPLLLEDLELEPAPMGRVLVLDKSSALPIEGVRVLYSKAVDAENQRDFSHIDSDPPNASSVVREARSDSKGLARLTLWRGSVCVVQAVAEGYQPAHQERLVPPFAELTRLELTRGGQITVHVRDDRGRGVAGMSVEHSIDGVPQASARFWDPEWNTENRTDEDGNVLFENLPSGKHEFKVLEKREAWGRGGESAGFEAEGEVLLAEGEEQSLDLRVAARGGLDLILFEGNEPLASALVKIQPLDVPAVKDNGWSGAAQRDPRTQISDHAGRVKFRGIKVGSYLLRVSHAERSMVIAREVLLTSPPGSLRMELGLAVVEGRLTDSTGEPLVGATVRVRRTVDARRDNDMRDYSVSMTEDEDGDANWKMKSQKPWSVESDGEGRFVLRGLAPGEVLRVDVSERYVIGGSRELGPLGEEQYLAPFDFQLERAGALDVVLEGVERRELHQYRLRLVRLEGSQEKESRKARLRSWRPRLTLQSLWPGRWRVELRRAELEEALRVRFVEIRVQETVELRLRL